MKAIRVAYAIDSLSSGGAQRQAVELALALAAQHEVEASFLVYHDRGFFADALREAGIEIHLIRKTMRLDPLFPRRLRSWLRANPVDVVHALLHAPSFWCVLALRGMAKRERPALLSAERNFPVAGSLAERLLTSLIYRRSDAVTANASAAVDEIEARCGVPRDRLHYLPNGIDLDAWDRGMALEPPVELDPQLFHVALIGRLAPQKNHRLMLESLARIGRPRLEGWKIWIIGEPIDGEFLDSLRREVASRDLSDHVTLLGPRPNVGALMKHLDLLVLPSLYEGFPNVVLEAMASRVPVVATSVGDVPNLVEHGRSGFLIRSGDAEELADALLRMRECSREERRAMGVAGRQIVEQRFQMRSIAAEHAKLYRSLVEHRGEA